VLGGGVAGCAVALALRQHGFDDILMIESGSYNSLQFGESIPPDTRPLFEQLDIWTDFLESGHDPCLGSCSSWGQDGVGYNDFVFNPHGTGWHLDRRRFDVFMATQVECRGIPLWRGTQFVSTRQLLEGEGFELQLRRNDDPLIVHARFVVDATGSRSRFAKSVGARQLFHDRLSWSGTFLTCPAAADFCQLTMIEAVEYGWWYAARLPDERVVVAVATDADTLKSTKLNHKEQWFAHLSSTVYMADWLGGCHWCDDYCDTENLHICVAPSFILDRTYGNNWMAVGDAASAYDPIVSQGIYKALQEGLQAAAAIARYQQGVNQDDDNGLEEYHSTITAHFTEYLNNRKYFYDLEQRWSAAIFWQRRRQRFTHLS